MDFIEYDIENDDGRNEYETYIFAKATSIIRNYSSQYWRNIPNLNNYTNIVEINCHGSFISDFKSDFSFLPSKLKKLDCSNNALTTLRNLPDTLEELDCSYNLLTQCDNLPPMLIKFNCKCNKITALPANLPPHIKYLNCSYNKITTKPNFPITISIENLDDSNNIYNT